MSRNRFHHLKSIIHFCNNEEWEENKADRGYKVRPLIQMMQRNFRKFGIFEKDLSVDEMIVKYYGHNSLKQFIRAKPIRFGYKFWALCGVSCYCFNFDLYCGKKPKESDQEDQSLGSKVVIQMLDAVVDPTSHSFFFR